MKINAAFFIKKRSVFCLTVNDNFLYISLIENVVEQRGERDEDAGGREP